MTAPIIKEALKPCPFCNGTDLDFCRNKDGWKIVQCMDCGACGPCIELDDDKSKGRWNTRAALATFQPSGERREAIARALAEKWPGDYMQGDDECEREPNALAYETADAAILASGLVRDEAGIRAEEREVAAQAALARIRKVRDGYANQAKFADVDPACYFREFVRRLDEAVSPKSAIRSARDGGEG